MGKLQTNNIKKINTISESANKIISISANNDFHQK